MKQNTKIAGKTRLRNKKKDKRKEKYARFGKYSDKSTRIQNKVIKK